MERSSRWNVPEDAMVGRSFTEKPLVLLMGLTSNGDLPSGESSHPPSRSNCALRSSGTVWKLFVSLFSWICTQRKSLKGIQHESSDLLT